MLDPYHAIEIRGAPRIDMRREIGALAIRVMIVHLARRQQSLADTTTNELHHTPVARQCLGDRPPFMNLVGPCPPSDGSKLPRLRDQTRQEFLRKETGTSDAYKPGPSDVTEDAEARGPRMSRGPFGRGPRTLGQSAQGGREHQVEVIELGRSQGVREAYELLSETNGWPAPQHWCGSAAQFVRELLHLLLHRPSRMDLNGLHVE